MSVKTGILEKKNEDSSIPTFVITPVADIVAKMKSAKQGTLTQMLGYPDSNQDFSDFVTPNPKKQKISK